MLYPHGSALPCVCVRPAGCAQNGGSGLNSVLFCFLVMIAWLFAFVLLICRPLGLGLPLVLRVLR